MRLLVAFLYWCVGLERQSDKQRRREMTVCHDVQLELEPAAVFDRQLL